MSAVQFRVRPLAAAIAAYTGIPEFERHFWQSKTPADIHLLYFSLLATPSKVLEIIKEPECMNAAEESLHVPNTDGWRHEVTAASEIAEVYFGKFCCNWYVDYCYVQPHYWPSPSTNSSYM